MDKTKIYWIWQNGKQVMVYYCTYMHKWTAAVNNSGRVVN